MPNSLERRVRRNSEILGIPNSWNRLGVMMDAWLRPAADYIADWLEFQLDTLQQPGVIIAITHRGETACARVHGEPSA